MQYFVATTDGSRLGLDELFERMERNGAKESRITFSRGADEPHTIGRFRDGDRRGRRGSAPRVRCCRKDRTEGHQGFGLSVCPKSS